MSVNLAAAPREPVALPLPSLQDGAHQSSPIGERFKSADPSHFMV